MTREHESDAPDGDEDLVAYLDGELDGDTAGLVESRIATDSGLRSKAESLKKTYDLLDYLPSPEPSPTFASRTITKLETPSAPIPATEPARPSGAFSHPSAPVAVIPPTRRNYWIAAACLVGLGISLAMGYVSHRLAKPYLAKSDPPKAPPPTLQQVRLYSHLPYYMAVDDLAFLKALDESEMFGDLGESESAPALIAKDAITQEELAKLQEVFQKLPLKRQEQLQQLDEDFFALPEPEHNKLLRTMERYAVWFDSLPDAARNDIVKAPAGVERLENVRMVRNRLRRDAMPEAVREKLKNATDDDTKDKVLADFRRQETERRREWEAAQKQWENLKNPKNDLKPFPFDNAALAQQVEDYVNTVLKPRLNPGEAIRLEELRKAATQDGGYAKWLFYGATIYHWAESHPSLPEPKSGKLILKVDDLPQDFVNKLRKIDPAKPNSIKRKLDASPQHGKWPDFAELVAQEAQIRNIPVPVALGPSRPGEFKAEVEETLKALQAKLTAKERTDLDALQGKWPQYPKEMVKLSRKYDLEMPGVSLPGLPMQWANVYRIKPKRF